MQSEHDPQPSQPEIEPQHDQSSFYDLKPMSVKQILLLNRVLNDHYYEAADQSHEHDDDAHHVAMLDAESIVSPFSGALEDLPFDDLEKGRAVALALAESESSYNRSSAVHCLASVLKVEHTLNSELIPETTAAWLRLLHDSDFEVRHIAGDSMGEAVDDRWLRTDIAQLVNSELDAAGMR